jgi:hypothetical protein
MYASNSVVFHDSFVSVVSRRWRAVGCRYPGVV